MDNLAHRYLLMDGEYAGTRKDGNFCSEYSILELYFEVLDENLETIAELDLKIKPDNDQYIVSAKSLREINFDLANHDLTAITEGKAKGLLYDFLNKHSDGGKIKLMPCGVNVKGDVDYITQHKFMSLGTWTNFCSHQTLDPSMIFMMLKIYGKMPQTIRPSTGKISNALEAVAAYLKINTQNMHSAKKDVQVFKEVFKRLVKYIKNCPKFT